MCIFAGLKYFHINHFNTTNIMGKGDKKTRRGKIMSKSYGKYRIHKVKVDKAPATTETKEA
jgi:ribosomal small subunit protein bTHX